MTPGHISHRRRTSRNQVDLGRSCIVGAPSQLFAAKAPVRSLLGSTQNRPLARQLLLPTHQALSVAPQAPLAPEHSHFLEDFKGQFSH